ncbi:MAG: hypothetical protein ACRDZN_07270 [Acidimicrobiales bacterium]
MRSLLDDLGVEWRSLNNYAEADHTAQLLRMAGFSDVRVWRGSPARPSSCRACASRRVH